MLIWSDHGSNFMGVKGDLKAFQELPSSHITQGVVPEFCSLQNIQWKHIPERTNFGRVCESAVRSIKTILKRMLLPLKLTFKEFPTILSQTETCLKSHSLTPANSPDDDGIAALTPGHFLIGRPLMSLPDLQLLYKSISLLKHRHLCQHLVHYFWNHWDNEYLCTINTYNKWKFPSGMWPLVMYSSSEWTEQFLPNGPPLKFWTYIQDKMTSYVLLWLRPLKVLMDGL